MNKNTVIRDPNDFDFEKFQITDTRIVSRVAISSILADGMVTGVQTDPIRIVGGNIPKIEKDCPTDSTKEYITIYLDPNQSSCCELIKHFNMADKYFGGDGLKNKMFGSNIVQYAYQPCLRKPFNCPKSGDDENEIFYDNTKQYKPFYCKMKFLMNNVDGKKVNMTKLIIGNEELKISSVRDLAEYIKFRTVCQFTFIYSKIWASDTSYGVSLVMTEISLKHYNNTQFPLYDMLSIRKTYEKYIKDKRSKKRIRLIEV